MPTVPFPSRTALRPGPSLAVMEPGVSRKKRVRPARKIVPRGNMGLAWIVGSVVIAGIIAIAGTWFLLTR